MRKKLKCLNEVASRIALLPCIKVLHTPKILREPIKKNLLNILESFPKF